MLVARKKYYAVRRLASYSLCLSVSLSLSLTAMADGIYMTNMKADLTPASRSELIHPSRKPGAKNGDVVEFVWSATVANAAGGPGAYFTAYLPAGVEVLGAWFVTDSTGATVRNAGEGGHANDGWGARGSKTPFGGVFASYLNGRQNDIYGDTGIFYSSDSRTQLFTADGSNVARGPTGNPTATAATSNGYNVTDTFYKAVDAFNLWDADQVNAFGAGGVLNSIPVNPAPTSSAKVINSIGQGVTPLGSGSSVAGPDTGYTLDNTGAIGPWQRIRYAGSQKADVSDGAATAVGLLDTPTSLDVSATGYALSDAAPLPVSANAVRFSYGLALLNEAIFVKVRVRLNASVLSATDGVVMNFESTGSDNWGTGSKDNPWRYFGPTFAQSAAVFVVQQIHQVNGVAYSGGKIPRGAKVTYRIRYLNLGAVPVSSAAIADKLSGSIETLGCTVTTPTLLNLSDGVTVNSVSSGTATCPSAGASINFGNLPNVVGGKLGGLRGGEFTYDIVMSTTAPDGTAISDTATFSAIDPLTGATLTNTSVASGAIGTPQFIDVVNSAGIVTQTGAKTFSVPYTIIVGNTGSAAATNVQAVDNLVRTFGSLPVVTVSAFSTAPVAPATAANCAGPTIAFNGSGNNLLLAGNQNLPVGGGCTIKFTANLDYGSNPLPTAVLNNDVWASAATSSNAGHDVPNSGAAIPPSNREAEDQSTDGNSLPASANGDTPSPTPVKLSLKKIGVTKKLVSVAQIGSSATYAITHDIKVVNEGDAALSSVAVNDQLIGSGATIPFTPAEVAGTGLGVQSKTILVPPALAASVPPTVAAVYDGTSINPTVASGGTLAPTDSFILRVVTHVVPSGGKKIGQAAVTSKDAFGNSVDDLSNNGDFPNSGNPGNDNTKDSQDAANNVPTEIRFAAISGKVWLDDNNNQIKDGSELALETTVAISGGGLVNPISISTTGGAYSTVVPASSTAYSITETNPALPAGLNEGYSLKPANTSANPALVAVTTPASSVIANLRTDAVSSTGAPILDYQNNDFTELPKGSIGLAKRVVTVVAATNPGEYDITHEYLVENRGVVPLNGVSVTDALHGTGAPATSPWIAAEIVGVQSVSTVAVMAGASGFVMSTPATYTGNGATGGADILLASSGNLPVNASAKFQTVMRVKPNDKGTRNTQANTSGKTVNNQMVTDTSTTNTSVSMTSIPAGGLPDDAANNLPTPITFGKISGVVYEDLNNNGMFEPSNTPAEKGIKDVTLSIKGDNLPAVGLTAKTDATGNYNLLVPIANATARFSVEQTQPAGYNDGKDTAGSVGGSSTAGGATQPANAVFNGGTDGIFNIVLSDANNAATGYNFGELVGGSIAIAKRVKSIAPVAAQAGQHDVTFEYNISNPSPVTIGNVSVIDPLFNGGTGVTVPFTAAEVIGVQSISVAVVSVGSTLSAAPAGSTGYTGNGANAMTQTLINDGSFAANATAQFSMTVRVKPNVGDHNGQATINGKDPGNVAVSDKSNDGSVPSADSLTPLPFAVISGVVYQDNNNDGAQAGVSEAGIASRGVVINGGNFSGTSLSISTATDTNGAYSFVVPVLAANDPAYVVTKNGATGGLSDGKAVQPVATGGSGLPSVSASAILATVKPATPIAFTGHNFAELRQGTIGLAKRVVSNIPVDSAPGQFDVVYEYNVVNTGPVELTNVQVTDTLVGAAGSGASFTPAEVVAINSLAVTLTPAAGSVLNLNLLTGSGAYDGTLANNVLASNTSNIKPGASASFQLKLRVKPNVGNHDSQADATAKDLAAIIVSDKSTDGPAPTAGDASKPANDIANNIKTPLNYATLSGAVFKDTNNNATQDVNEPGIASVALLVKNGALPATGAGSSIITTTKADGTFSVTVPAGANYQIEETQPVGYGDGKDTAGTGANANNGVVVSGTGQTGGVGADRITAINASNPINYAGYNFGESIGTLSGHVWFDLNKDKTQISGEPDFKDISVRVYPCCGYVNSATGQNYLDVKTDTSGNYSVDVPAGVARAVVTPPNGFDLTTIGLEDQSVTVAPVGISAAQNVGYFPLGPDIKVTQSHSPAKFTINNNGSYTITVNNVGQQPTTGVYTVLDQLPAGFKIDTTALVNAGAGWTCSVVATSPGDRIKCDSTAVIAAGATGASPITLKVRVADTVATSVDIANEVLVKGGGEITADRLPTPAEEAALIDANIALPACGPANACQDLVQVQKPAAIIGSVWLENGSTNQQFDNSEKPLVGWRVAVIDYSDPINPVVKGTAMVDANGNYKIDNLEPTTATSKYRVQFYDDTHASIDPLKAMPWLNPANNSGATQSASNKNRFALDISDLPPGTTLAKQDMPLDPSGVVYDAVTRQPVANSVVQFCRDGAALNPSDLLNGSTYVVVNANCVSMTTGASGAYQFVLQAGVSGTFSLSMGASPPGYLPGIAVSIPPKSGSLNTRALPAGIADANPATSAFEVQAQAGSPAVGQLTTYFVSFILNAGSKDVIHNHIPLDPAVPTKIFVSITGDRSVVELGDTLKYTVEVRHVAGSPLPAVTAPDSLPAGFRYIPGSAVLNGVAAADNTLGLSPTGAQLNFKLGPLAAKKSHVLTYRARAAVGSMEGNGTNSVQATSGTIQSNTAQYTVKVTGGVFGRDACVLGKIFIDCNGNSIQDAEEIGIPGVRLYFEDGTYLVSDVEGKYSYCGLNPMTHVLKVDATTLPRGSRLTTSSNRNVGDANSLFIDLKNGELHRADFIEGSCSNTVLEQVKARRSQGEVRAPETEKTGAPALKFSGKATGRPPQATDSADQSTVKPRLKVPESSPDASAESEVNLPVPTLPSASPNTVTQ